MILERTVAWAKYVLALVASTFRMLFLAQHAAPRTMDDAHTTSPVTNSRTEPEIMLPELWLHTMRFLPAAELCRLSCVCREFRACAAQDSLWRPICATRWADKQNVRVAGGTWKDRYDAAERDSRRRGITEEEICYFRYAVREMDTPLRHVYVLCFAPGGSCFTTGCPPLRDFATSRKVSPMRPQAQAHALAHATECRWGLFLSVPGGDELATRPPSQCILSR